jgi:hypothetical protein
MTDVERAAEVRGRTIRLTWTEGPTKGTTHEHVFHEDGTVEWSVAGGPRATASPEAAPKGHSAKERVEYAAMRAADDVYAVSYLAPSGYTLSVVLNFDDYSMVGFASGAKAWHPVRGTFELVE